MKETNHCTISP